MFTSSRTLIAGASTSECPEDKFTSCEKLLDEDSNSLYSALKMASQTMGMTSRLHD